MKTSLMTTIKTNKWKLLMLEQENKVFNFNINVPNGKKKGTHFFDVTITNQGQGFTGIGQEILRTNHLAMDQEFVGSSN